MQTSAVFDPRVIELQSFLLANNWVSGGSDFFHSLAEYLARFLNADYICIDKLHGNLEAETVAVWYDGHFEDNYTYKLTDTPCGEVLSQNVCAIAQHVRHLFPKDEFLQIMLAESYAGITLRDTYGRAIGLIAVISRKPADNLDMVEGVLRMVAVRVSAELEHRKSIRAFEGLTLSAHSILTSENEEELMRDVCKIIVEYCDYSMMWIGLVKEDTAKSIIPVAYAGFEEGYLEKLNLTYATTERGRGPTGTAVRVGQPYICMDISTDPNFTPWRKDALERGYHSSIAIPLLAEGKTIGVITVYASTPDYFWNDDIHLLTRFSNDLSAGILALRHKRERASMLVDLHMSNELLEVTVCERTAVLIETNKILREEIETRKLNEKLLRQTELKYRTVADFAYEAESWMGVDGKFLYVSPSFERITGYKAAEFLNDSSLYYNIAHPADRDLIKAHFDHVMFPNDETCNLQFRIITRNGEEKWIGHTCRPVYNEEGDWIGQRGSNRDITSEKQYEATLIDTHKHLRALMGRLDEIAEEERKNIAREIHDELGHLLTAIRFEIDNLSYTPNATIDSLGAEISAINKHIDDLINAIRKISSELRPDMLDLLGLIPALQWQVKEFTKRTKICCVSTMDNINYTFNSKQTIVIFRILQEILTNIARHSDAKHVRVFLVEKKDMFVLKVTDNGKGFRFDKEMNSNALGLIGMHERALSIGGDLSIETSEGNGTSVTLKLPIKTHDK